MENFTNETIDLQKLPKYEETQLTSPDPKYWKIILINLVLFLAIVGATLTLVVVLKAEARDNWMLWVGLYVAFSAFIALIYRASFKRRGFALREKDVLYKSGIIAETTTIVPLNRIQHVALNEGFLSRMFQLGTLQIYTAGGTSGQISIAGVPIDQAKAVKEALVQRLVINAKPETE